MKIWDSVYIYYYNAPIVIVTQFKKVLFLSGHSPCFVDSAVEEEEVRTGQGGHQSTRQLHRQPLLSLWKWILKKTPIKTQVHLSTLIKCHFADKVGSKLRPIALLYIPHFGTVYKYFKPKFNGTWTYISPLLYNPNIKVHCHEKLNFYQEPSSIHTNPNQKITYLGKN